MKTWTMAAAAMLACATARADEAKPAAAAEAAKTAAPAAASVTVVKSVVCTGVSDREPVGAKDAPAQFEAAVEKLYFWNSAEVKEPPQTITHVWSKDGKEVARIALELKHGRSRTWSLKKVYPGKWKVEARAADGAVLQSAEFSVK